MASTYLFSFLLLLSHNLMNCGSASVHGHKIENLERASDGAFKQRDADHYNDLGHNMEFDHEAILGSVKEAEVFDHLPPEESKRRLSLLLPKMDLNEDEHIDRDELKRWILNSFRKLSREEAEESFRETDFNGDELISWEEYLQEAFGIESNEELNEHHNPDTDPLVFEELAMWKIVDKDLDNFLNFEEFEMLTNPEEHEEMHPYLVNQTMREKDTNKNDLIEFQEYIAERGEHQDRAWLVAEREKFDHDLDTNHDGALDRKEVAGWIIPSNEQIATEEVDHLFAAADDDHDDLLSFDEIIYHYDVFVGSEINNNDDMFGAHFSDEL